MNTNTMLPSAGIFAVTVTAALSPIGITKTTIFVNEAAMIKMRDVGNNLRLSRVVIGMTQQEVADRLGLPRTAIGKIERGEQDVSAIHFYEMTRMYGRSADLELFLEESFFHELPKHL